MNIFKNMEIKLKELSISPIFFIGSGISRRYIDSPDWKGLLQSIRNDWDRSFKHYYQKHTINGECNFEELATELEKMYFDKMTDDDLEEDKDKRYYFRNRISDIFKTCLIENSSSLINNKEIEELKKTSPSAIITTNYDELLETIFPQYSRFIGQTQLLSTIVDGIGEIYKIHGCVSDPYSIVITKEDYDDFFEKSLYLNAKLLTLFLEYPIIFMGYSLSDRNVKSVLSSIVTMLPPEKVEELNKRIWFLRRNEEVKDYSKIERIDLIDGKFIDIETFYVKDFSNFFKVISNKDMPRLPIKFLKFLKSNTYELISSQKYDPKKLDVNLAELESIEDFNDSSNFIGITLRSKIKKEYLLSSDICEAFIKNNYSMLDKFSVLNYILKNNEKVPVYWQLSHLTKEEIEKHISESSFIDNSKKRVLEKVLESKNENFVLDIGTDRNINFSYKSKIVQEDIDKYVEKILSINNLQSISRGVIKRYLYLYLCYNRLDDVLDNEDFIKNNRKNLCMVLTNLEKDFIRNNYEKIYKFIGILNNNDFNSIFRTTLCYIDIAINKPAY